MSGQVFGRPRNVTGKSGEWPATLVPLALLQAIKTPAIPITISGSSAVTFTVNAGVTNPVPLWNGNDFIELRETLAHTMDNSATNSVIATTGVLSSAQTPGSTGVKYYYIGQDTEGAISLHPSTVKPSTVEGAKGTGYLGHPGITRDRHWRYVGFSHMSATTPVFSPFAKTGYQYNFSNHVYAGADTQNAYVSMAVVPAHDGVRVGGWVTGPVTSLSLEIGGATHFTVTNSVVGAHTFRVDGISVAATGEEKPNFTDINVNSDGNMLVNMSSDFALINIAINRIVDVV